MANQENNPVAFGVTSAEMGRTRKPVYLVTAIEEDGTIRTITSPVYASWQEVAQAAKTLAAQESKRQGELVEYWIADQVKAFQKRLANS